MDANTAPGVSAELPVPGLYRGVPEAVYRAWPYVSQSMLKELKRSPMHARHALTHPKAPTAAMEFGTRAHMVCLEPGRLEREFQIAPKGLDRRTVKGKAEWNRIIADGREPLKQEDYDALVTIRDALYANPDAHALLAGTAGANELSIVWDDYAGTGAEDRPPLRCKARLDRLTTWDGWPTIVDLKKIASAEPRWLPFRVGDYSWHIQAAAYRRAAAALDELQARPPVERRFVWIFVEEEPPHGITIGELDAASLYEADEQYRDAMETWSRCDASGHWPGYPSGVSEFPLPEKYWRRE